MLAHSGQLAKPKNNAFKYDVFGLQNVKAALKLLS